jgi:hypothetical protein
MLLLPLDFGLGMWRLHTVPNQRLQFLYCIGYFQPISLDSQQSLAIQSHGLSTWMTIGRRGPCPLLKREYWILSVDFFFPPPLTIELRLIEGLWNRLEGHESTRLVAQVPCCDLHQGIGCGLASVFQIGKYWGYFCPRPLTMGGLLSSFTTQFTGNGCG